MGDRYNISGFHTLVNTNDGYLVKHSDYEALEAKLATLEKLLQAHQTRGNTTEAHREDK